MAPQKITTPLSPSTLSALCAGERILLSGPIYTGRDAAHKRMVGLLDAGEALPFAVEGQAIYYAGPCPAPPGRPIGSVGPTTSQRMDAYAPRLMGEGLRIMIGKGLRGPAVVEAMVQYGGLYLAAVGGAGALMALCVEAAQPVAFPDLGPEAIYRLIMRDMPLVVAIDCRGNSIYER